VSSPHPRHLVHNISLHQTTNFERARKVHANVTMQTLWIGVVFMCLVTWLLMLAAVRRVQLQRQVIKKVMVTLGVPEAQFEEMKRREEE
jgi:hypothetical protein